MKVYQAAVNVHYQGLLPEDRNAWQGDLLLMNGKSKSRLWVPPVVYSLYPMHKRGDFWGWGGGGFVVAPEAMEKVKRFLDPAGELLPLPYEGQTFWLFNILECLNCLNPEKTRGTRVDKTGQPDKTGNWISIKKYAFYPDRFTQSVFSIPEVNCSRLFAVEESGDPEWEFKAFVEAEGLTGLQFEEVWDIWDSEEEERVLHTSSSQ